MAFPYLSDCSFGDNTTGHFDSETDGDAKLNIRHYTYLSRFAGRPMPWSGAYCMEIDLSGGTGDASLVETGDWDMADDETQYWRWMMWVDPDIVMADTNQFDVFRLQSGTGPFTTEAVCALQYTTANGVRIGIGETAATSFTSLPLGQWNCIEVGVLNDAEGAGTIDLWVNGGAATQVGSITAAAITQGQIGALGIDAGTTAGLLYFDEIQSDDARLGVPRERWSESTYMTLTGHAFVGPGTLSNVQLRAGGGTDNIITIYDTDTASTRDATAIKALLQATTANSVVDVANKPIHFERGAYVTLAGTNPRALLQIDGARAWGSEGAIRNYAARRAPRPGDT